MKTLDLARTQITLEELLALASAGAVRIVTADGHAFVLEDADARVCLSGDLNVVRRFVGAERPKNRWPGTSLRGAGLGHDGPSRRRPARGGPRPLYRARRAE